MGFPVYLRIPLLAGSRRALGALEGRSLLSEFPELCGVEQELVARCIGRAVAARFIQLMRYYASRARAVGSDFDINPLPGNIRDGLLTDGTKSAGDTDRKSIAPVLKISTNSPLAQRMQDIIDIDTGAVISGKSTMEEMGDALLERLVEVASGQLRTKVELLGQDDFIPWKRGGPSDEMPRLQPMR
jgi:altronate hydrolase